MEPPAPPPPVAMPPTMGKHPPLATIAVPTGLAPHAWEAYAAADPRAEGGTCEGCKVSKVRCFGSVCQHWRGGVVGYGMIG